MQKVAVLYNPSSGRGRSIRKKSVIEKCLKKYNIKYDLFISKSEDHLIALSKEKIQNHKIIVGVGGDTTLNIIATEVMKRYILNQEIPNLGMIGTGSVNDVVQGLGIQTIDSACRSIKNNQIKRMDVGCVKTNTREGPIFFLGNLSSGLGASVNLYVEDFNKKRKRIINYKFFNQTFPGLLGIRNSFKNNYIPIKIKLECNSMEKEVNFSILTFLNTACFADGMKLSPGANPYDGMLDCCIISSTSFSNSVILGLLAYRALHLKSKKTSIIRSNSFKVTSDQQMDFLVDGQIVKGVGEFEVSVIHKALGIFGI